MSHAAYIAWAYGIAAIALAGLVAHALVDLRRQTRALASLERAGARRRRPAAVHRAESDA